MYKPRVYPIVLLCISVGLALGLAPPANGDLAEDGGQGPHVMKDRQPVPHRPPVPSARDLERRQLPRRMPPEILQSPRDPAHREYRPAQEAIEYLERQLREAEEHKDALQERLERLENRLHERHELVVRGPAQGTVTLIFSVEGPVPSGPVTVMSAGDSYSVMAEDGVIKSVSKEDAGTKGKGSRPTERRNYALKVEGQIEREGRGAILVRFEGQYHSSTHKVQEAGPSENRTTLDFSGSIRIEPGATRVIASQEDARVLLTVFRD